jgi:hypothetical protein
LPKVPATTFDCAAIDTADIIYKAKKEHIAAKMEEDPQYMENLTVHQVPHPLLFQHPFLSIP